MRLHAFLMVLALAVAIAGCQPAIEPVAEAPRTKQPTASPTPATVEPTPEPKSRPQPHLAAVKLRRVRSVTTGNWGILGRRPNPPPQRAARRAATQAVRELERYLNAQFVRPRTRFASASYRRLLTARAEATLNARARRALGELRVRPVNVRARRARADAVVLRHGRRVFGVTLDYKARFRLSMPNGRSRPLVQQGTLLFIPRGSRWLATAADVDLDMAGSTARRKSNDRAQAQDDQRRKTSTRRDRENGK